jgi:hypothetical protein
MHGSSSPSKNTWSSGASSALRASSLRPSRSSDPRSGGAAAALEISEAAFRKRLSRAREALDGFVHRHCGVANPANACRCRYQINHNVRHGRPSPSASRCRPNGYFVSGAQPYAAFDKVIKRALKGS